MSKTLKLHITIVFKQTCISDQTKSIETDFKRVGVVSTHDKHQPGQNPSNYLK